MSLLHGLLSVIFPPMPEPIGELRPRAMATVRGRVVPRDVIESPLDGERCVYYHYTVEQFRQSGVVTAGEGFWQMTERDEAIVEFYLQDVHNARVIVAPQRARVERGKGVDVANIDVGMLDRRAQQLIIKPGDWIEVTGLVDEVDDLLDEDRTYRVSPARYLLRAPAGDAIAIRLLPEEPE